MYVPSFSLTQPNALTHSLRQGDIGLDTVDLTADNPLLNLHASARVPALQTLTWAPAWRGAYSTDRKRYNAAMRAYRGHLLAILEPIQLRICVSATHALQSWSDENHLWGKSNTLSKICTESRGESL